MLIYFLLFFTIIPLVELLLLIRIGGFIGIVNTIAMVALTGILGGWLARSQGIRVLGKINETWKNGQLPGDELISGFLVLIGGLLLITPGVMTDFFGFMLMIPGNRRLIGIWLKNRFRGRFHLQGFPPMNGAPSPTDPASSNGKTIDAQAQVHEENHAGE